MRVMDLLVFHKLCHVRESGRKQLQDMKQSSGVGGSLGAHKRGSNREGGDVGGGEQRSDGCDELGVRQKVERHDAASEWEATVGVMGEVGKPCGWVYPAAFVVRCEQAVCGVFDRTWF